MNSVCGCYTVKVEYGNESHKQVHVSGSSTKARILDPRSKLGERGGPVTNTASHSGVIGRGSKT